MGGGSFAEHRSGDKVAREQLPVANGQPRPSTSRRTVKALLARIESNAAKRLPLLSGRKPAEELARYRAFLKEESARLKILHRGGEGGLVICRARTAVMDHLVRHVFAATQAAFPPKGRIPKISLVAYGGYGRAELNPCSDVDLMFLQGSGLDLKGDAQATFAEWTSAVLYTLWDIGLTVGNSVRTVADCIRVANQDMQSKTSLLEARLVDGDEALFAEFQRKFHAKCVRGHEDEYIGQRLDDQRTRRARHGNSAAMQEPNIKNGCGGLRDFQNLLWMTYFKLGARTLADLEEAELIDRSEKRQLETAYDFLLRTRNELHYTTGTPVDVLAANVKPPVSAGLDYPERSPRLRVEHFMRDYYTHARNLYLITRTLEQRLALVPTPKTGRRKLISKKSSPARPAQEIDGFKIVDNQLVAPSRVVFREDPGRLIRCFLYAQQRGLSLHPDLAQMLRQLVSGGAADGWFLRSASVTETMLEILNQRGNVAPTLRAMHEVGLLGRVVPEFGRMTNLVQHEFYHQFAVDEHTLVCLEKLDRVWDATKSPFRHYAELFQGIERPYVLYLALLLHDSGKAYPGRRHEIVGGELAVSAAKRLRLNAATTQTLRLLIELHLLLVQVSQRRDLEDQEVIRQVANQVGRIETMDLLMLHTFADSMGTSDTLWNGFKDSLLWQLYRKTREVLLGGTEFIRAEVRQRERLKEDVSEILPKTFTPDEVDAHFSGMPSRYFHLHEARAIARDLTLVHRFMHLQITADERALEPAVLWQDAPDRGYAGVHVCTWDRAGLFSKLTGAFAAAGLNILAAQIYTRPDGIVLDDFFVVEARTGQLPEPGARERFERIVIEILVQGVDPKKYLARSPIYQPLYLTAGEEFIPSTVRFDNASSDAYTIMDLETEDRVGLLFAVTRTLAELGLNIALAKILTEKGAAIDTFYFLDRDGEKITEHDRQEAIIARLREAIEQLDRH
jgi:[protein-PII] uridylyltransferase